MMPTDDGSVESGQSFCEEVISVVVAFKVDGPRGHDDDERDCDADADEEDTRHKLRMSFKASYKPPIVTFRFSVNVFGHDEGGKKEKTTLYFDVPPHHISSLEQTHHVDTAELGHDDLAQFSGGVTRVRFLLQRPGHLVQPARDLTLKPASQRTLASMALLASVSEFVLFMPHTTLSKEQFRCLEEAVTSPVSRHDLQLQDKEHDWWLGALYGGVGGRLFNKETSVHDDDSTASESGDSTIATATPPAYRSAPDGDAAAGEPGNVTGDADSPPPYDQLESEDGAPTDRKGMLLLSLRCDWDIDILPGKQPGKRLRDSPDPDIRLYRRRLVSPPVDGASEKLESNPVALVLSKLEQVLMKAEATEEENRSLRAELAAMRQRQDRLEEMVRRHDRRTQDLEAEGAELDTRVDGLEERQAELEDRQGRMEDKCDSIEMEISDQVHSALRERLLGALETM
ncbi:hypothetical protein PG985_013034 [Apiospora marii]|uniref:Uncharacterized protein n=1 Tax=Apiospora marii TaxID=335849 RepID=A0ABR1RBJ3_9PEZI